MTTKNSDPFIHIRFTSHDEGIEILRKSFPPDVPFDDKDVRKILGWGSNRSYGLIQHALHTRQAKSIDGGPKVQFTRAVRNKNRR